MEVDNINTTSQKTIQQIIDDSSQKTSGRNTGELGKNDFLNLLITQLKYQDPMKPLEDKEFIAQMAQFSALEQMQNLNQRFAATQAFSLLGKEVSANMTDDKTKAASIEIGKVEGVRLNSGKAYLQINGKDVSVDQVISVSE